MVAEACKTKMAFRVRGSELSIDALKPINRIIKRHVHNLLVHFKYGRLYVKAKKNEGLSPAIY